MKVRVDVSGDLAAAMEREIRAGKRAVSKAMSEAGDGLKKDWRGQIVGAGLGRRLANSIRSASYPRGRDSVNAASLVWAEAPDIIAAHDQGVLIRSPNGFWLAIPTPAAGKGLRGKRMTPSDWEARHGLRLRHVILYRKGQRGLAALVADARENSRGLAVRSRSKSQKNVKTIPIFWLVEQVSLKRVLDLAKAADRWADRVPGLIVDAWTEDRFGG